MLPKRPEIYALAAFACIFLWSMSSVVQTSPPRFSSTGSFESRSLSADAAFYKYVDDFYCRWAARGPAWPHSEQSHSSVGIGVREQPMIEALSRCSRGAPVSVTTIDALANTPKPIGVSSLNLVYGDFNEDQLHSLLIDLHCEEFEVRKDEWIGPWNKRSNLGDKCSNKGEPCVPMCGKTGENCCLFSVVFFQDFALFEAFPPSKDDFFKRVETSFYHTAGASGSDKVTVHQYQRGYTKYVQPDFNGHLLEIGLGCGMNEGSGLLWPNYLKHASISYVEYNEECGRGWIKNHQELVDKRGMKFYFGDQSDPKFLSQVAHAHRHNLVDVLIDDGGHQNHHIFTSFQFLWSIVKPGGLYIVEDMMQSGTWPHFTGDEPAKQWHREKKNTPAHDVMVRWTDVLIEQVIPHRDCASFTKPCIHDVEWVECQLNWCVIKKRGAVSVV